MTTIPNNWIDEDRHEIVENIVNGIMDSLSEEETKRMVWDMLYDDLVFQEWPDLFMYAETYAPALLEEFDNNASKESSH
jgi:hypothetical protein